MLPTCVSDCWQLYCWLLCRWLLYCWLPGLQLCLLLFLLPSVSWVVCRASYHLLLLLHSLLLLLLWQPPQVPSLPLLS
jgi:hypothetical protein